MNKVTLKWCNYLLWLNNALNVRYNVDDDCIEVNIDDKWVKTKLVPSVQTLTKQITVTNSNSTRTVIVDDVNTIYSVKLITVDGKTPSEANLYITNLFINGNVFTYGLINTQGGIGTYSYTQVIEIEYK